MPRITLQWRRSSLEPRIWVEICSQASSFTTGKFLDCIHSKLFAIQARSRLYPHGHFAKRKQKASCFSWTQSAADEEVDELDHKILKAITLDPGATNRDLARTLEMPHSSFDYRLKRLEQIGVIRGYGYALNNAELGLQTYRVLITARDPDIELRDSLTDYCDNSAEVHVFIECIGTHDYVLVINVWEPIDAFEIGQSIQEKFRHKIRSVTVIPMFRVLQHFSYPYPFMNPPA